MTFPWIKALHYIGLAMLLGGPAFWYLIWCPARRSLGHEPSAPLRSEALLVTVMRGTMTAGFLLFGLSGLLDIMRAAAELFGTLYWDDFVYFAVYSGMGRVILARLAVGGLFLLTGLRLSRKRQTFGWLAPLVAGLGVVVLVSALSHQASADSRAPLIADIIHLIATCLWGGGLLYFALLPWSIMRSEEDGPPLLAAIAGRFSTLGTLSVIVVSATGVYISFQQFYSLVAVTGTPYGIYLLRKLAGFALVLSVAAFHHYFFVPKLQEGWKTGNKEKMRRVGTKFLRLVRVETLLIIGVLIAAGFLTTTMPPTSPVGLVDVAHESGRFGENSYELTLLPREQGQVLFELIVEDADGQPITIQHVELDLTMLDHYMPPYVLPMEEASPGVYRATALLSMGGRWHVTARWSWAGGTHETAFEFDTISSFRDVSRERRYAISAIAQKRWGWALFGLYGVLTILGAVALYRGARQPRSSLLITLGILLLLGGGAYMARVAEVPGPYSYRVNPVRRTEAVMARGAELYRANCLMCHGETGRGDGPAAAGLNPRPADFTEPSGIDNHSDGELYWFITKGIPGSSMPAFEAILTDEERWMLVHYVRSFSEAAR